MRPRMLYGTAWKEDDTRRLVALALAQGFRAIDTANQRKHYHEVAVGEALADAYAAGTLRREDLCLQTKFTHRDGQDHRLPYDPDARIAEQVKQSFESSCEHLGATTLDSYVLHGPSTRHGLGSDDIGAWRAMESLHAGGHVRALGASNVTREQLEELLGLAEVAPSFVQNRCYARTGWDRDVRASCTERGIVYQGFSLLTANRAELARPSFVALARRLGLTASQLVFRFALDVGMMPLTGTSSSQHMKEDLAVLEAEPLEPRDVAAIEAISRA